MQEGRGVSQRSAGSRRADVGIPGGWVLRRTEDRKPGSASALALSCVLVSWDTAKLAYRLHAQTTIILARKKASLGLFGMGTHDRKRSKRRNIASILRQPWPVAFCGEPLKDAPMPGVDRSIHPTPLLSIHLHPLILGTLLADKTLLSWESQDGKGGRAGLGEGGMGSEGECVCGSYSQLLRLDGLPSAPHSSPGTRPRARCIIFQPQWNFTTRGSVPSPYNLLTRGVPLSSFHNCPPQHILTLPHLHTGM